MKDSDKILLDNQLCFALYSTSLAMTQLYKEHLDKLGLTYTQYTILLILFEKDGITLKEIADKLGQKSGSLTPVIKRMEAEEILIRQRGVEDDRQLNILLTEKGQKLREDILVISECVAESCGISVDKLIDLRSQLTELRENLKQKTLAQK
ncbi:MarR family winged helix-turn-helix transcriptional regulator [Curvivirga sp.]|uniref:MarR family winged helix-turn-helix transcriptional regulator n=1 Tax=Curvivirga sp. TaxID=2856848 RepID=UPI003B5C913A